MKKLFLLSLFPLAALADDCPVVEEEVTYSQKTSGSRLVTIDYTLSNAPGIVTVDVLLDGVSIGAENFSNVGGDVNRLVQPGPRKILWQADKSWPGRTIEGERVSFKVSAWATNNPPPYMVVDLNNGSTCYYVSTNALPEGGLTNDLYRTDKLVMRRIPAGGTTSTLGETSATTHTSPVEDLHLVTFTSDYWMGIFELTRRQYALMNRAGTMPGDDDCLPLNKLSYNMLRTGSNTHNDDYSWPGAGHSIPGTSALGKLREISGVEFDLPTDAQWEFAARAGATTPHYWGADSSNATAMDYAWFSKNSGGALHRVGEKIPNAWGLYDVCGNISEFTLSNYDSSYVHPDSEIDPKGSTVYTTYRGKRGGAYWTGEAINTRCSKNDNYGGETGSNYSEMGFRLCAPIY